MQHSLLRYLVDLSPFLCGLVGEPLVDQGHNLIEQLTGSSEGLSCQMKGSTD